MTETDLNNKVSQRLKCTLQYQNKPGEKIVDSYQGAQDRIGCRSDKNIKRNSTFTLKKWKVNVQTEITSNPDRREA